MPSEGPNALKPITGIPGSPPSTSKETGPKKVDEEKLKKTCRDFESIFLGKLMKTMRQSVPRSGLFKGGGQQEMYQSICDEEISKSLARRGGIGLGDMMFRNMAPGENRYKSPAGETPADFKPLRGRRAKEE